MSGGFTLIESLIALAVLSLVVIATSQSLITSARSGALIDDKRAALAVAQATMETALSAPRSTAQGRSNGIAWQIDRKAWSNPQAQGLIHLAVTAHPVGKPHATVTLETLVDGGTGR